jgi:hypothetical protein
MLALFAGDIPKIADPAYYRAPIDNLRTYSVYWPPREPNGYWQWIERVGPRPLVEPKTLKRTAQFIAAGERVFAEWDVAAMRTGDFGWARSVEELTKRGYAAAPDGTVPDLRWVPTSDGVKLGVANCTRCHAQVLPEYMRVRSGPGPHLAVVAKQRAPADLMHFMGRAGCESRPMDVRLPDAALYALVEYLYSLEARMGPAYSRR